jgi:hypothetical protein
VQHQLFANSQSRKAFIVNVGVNLSHNISSPIFSDGTFEFVPIPEGSYADQAHQGVISCTTYDDLYCYNTTEKLLTFYSERLQEDYRRRIAHPDPNLNNPNDGSQACFTYGDVPFSNARASSLRHARRGDLLIFIANLATYDRDRRHFTGERNLYFIGVIEIADVYEYSPLTNRIIDITTSDDYDPIIFKENAHVNHLYTLENRYRNERFTIFQGGKRSIRFKYAVAVTRQLCDDCLRDKNGKMFDYAKFRSLNACVGSYTRAVRPAFVIDGDDAVRFHSLLGYITKENEISPLNYLDSI